MNSKQQTAQENDEIEVVLGLGQASPSYWVKFRKLIWFGIAAVTVIAVYMLWGPGSNSPATQYKTESVTRSDLTVIVTATGTLQPTNTVDISSELSGTIRKVMVDFNSKVKVDQVLAELDTDKLKASVASSEAKLLAARAKVRNTQATATEKKLAHERIRELFARKVSSANDLEASKAAYERALAAVESARADVAATTADLKLNKINLAKACICSPINGIILKRNVEPGQTVATSLQAPILFTIAEDLAKMEVQVDVDEADVGKVKQGQKAIFTVDAYPDKKFSAHIRELHFGSEVVQGVVTYKAILTTNNSGLLLRPGMTATAEIIVRQVKAAMSVPNAALRFSPPNVNEVVDNRSFLKKLLPGRPNLRAPSARGANGPNRKIWMLADGQPKQVAVIIGSTDGKRTQIVKGDIQPGQDVIVDIITTKK